MDGMGAPRSAAMAPFAGFVKLRLRKLPQDTADFEQAALPQ